MKLLIKTNRYYIIIAVAMLIVGTTVIALRIIGLTDNEVSERLRYTKEEIDRQLVTQPFLGERAFVIGDKIEVTPIDTFKVFRIQFTNTLVYDKYTKTQVPVRILSYETQIGDRAYHIAITRRLSVNRNIFGGAAVTIVLMGLAVVFGFYFLNAWFSREVWRPFYSVLKSLRGFDVVKRQTLELNNSDIDEFNDLNSEVFKLTFKISQDYNNLKEFTENTSHETQTPLAIIHSKLELLLQAPNLTSEQLQMIQSTIDASNRLSKLNKELVLLTKIENRQFIAERPVSFKELIEKNLDQLESFIEMKELKIETNLDAAVTLNINQQLAEILISNLLTNAIKYNIPNGTIRIKLSPALLSVSNTGGPLRVDPTKIFERFRKDEKSESLGLGLSIVKKITELYLYRIKYTYENSWHAFTVEFFKSKE
jgi:signal transduction histidine kinase